MDIRRLRRIDSRDINRHEAHKGKHRRQHDVCGRSTHSWRGTGRSRARKTTERDPQRLYDWQPFVGRPYRTSRGGYGLEFKFRRFHLLL